MSLAAPASPDFALPWEELDRTFEWIRRLRACPQDPEHHAEGDAWIHTRMVCEALSQMSAWRGLEPGERAVTWLGALLHDVAKPDCTRTDADGRIHARGHSVRGAILARQILWRMGVPFEVREQVSALVRQHQTPFYLVEREDARALALGISVASRCDHLSLVAEADARGRTCKDQQRILDGVEMFRDYCREERCFEGPWEFPSEEARFRYFHEGRGPSYAGHGKPRCEVIVMSGLPGAGKDTWIAQHAQGLPVVSLDALREELDVDPEDSQGAIVQAARERAREHLRAGRTFVWNATNLSRMIRGQCVRLAADYGARVRIVYVEASAHRLFAQNRARARAVPERVIEKLLDRWEVPDLTEAHAVEVVADNLSGAARK
jgi:predicted kinase